MHELDKTHGSETVGQLTADIDGLCEGRCDLRVQFYDQVSVLSYLIITLFYTPFNKVRNWLAYDGEQYVDDELPRHARHVTLIRKIIHDSGVLRTLLEEALNAEALVKRCVQRLD